ncbi:MAG: hypothetical protein VX278_00855, partial [Myxococcota bacterium]|nr:hypothetical protein [Myxococcota bacterium]
MYALSTADKVLVEQGILTQKGILQAHKERSPRLAEYICKLLILDPAPRKMFIEARRGTPTFKTLHPQIATAVMEKHQLLRSLPNKGISKLDSLEHTWQGHRVVWENLTSDVMAPLLPERVHLNDVIGELWNDSSSYAREQLLLILKHARLLYGVWRSMKKIFKEAERRYDWEVYAILIDRFRSRPSQISRQHYPIITSEDQAQKIKEMKLLESWKQRERKRESDIQRLESKSELTPEEEARIEALHEEAEQEEEAKPVSGYEPSVVNWNHVGLINSGSSWYVYTDASISTRSYLRRRALRTLRRLAADLPDAFPAAAAEIVVRTNEYFGQNLLKPYESLWSRQMLPLLKLVEEAPHSRTVKWAYEMLKKYFRLELKTIDGDWLYRVSQSKIESTRAIALSYLENDTGVGIGNLHDHGYHKTIISFLSLGKNMPEHSKEAEDYAIIYIRGQSIAENSTAPKAIAETLTLDEVCILLKRGGRYRKLGEHLILGTDKKSPYEEYFTLDFFTSLLEDSQTFDLGAAGIKKRYTGTELTAAWYGKRVLSPLKKVRTFALSLLQDPAKYSVQDDWTQFCVDIIHHLKADDAIYEEAFRRLSMRDSEDKCLLDNRARVPISFVRFMLLHPSGVVVNKILALIEQGVYDVRELGVPFLKALSTRREFKSHILRDGAFAGENYAGSYIDEPFLLLIKKNKEKIYNSSVGQSIRRWLIDKNLFHLHDIGLDWCFERIERWSSDYQFVRTLFARDVTFAEIAGLLPNLTLKDPTSDLHVRGAQQVAWFIYDKCLDAGSKKANFYKRLLIARNPRYRTHKSMLSELSPEQVFPQEAFDFDWFLRWAQSKREPIRAYAIEMARYEMAYWLSSQAWQRMQEGYAKPISAFDKFRPLFSGFNDVEKAIKRAIYTPLYPKEHSRIDLKGNAIFDPESLYRYCFGRDDRPRDFALGVIRNFPDKYGRLENLLSLSDSSDPSIRQLVVEVLWKKYSRPITTPGWKPFPYSVVPFELSRAVDPLRKEMDPNALKIRPEDVKGAHYLGTGSPEAVEHIEAVDHEDQKRDLHEFIRRILYTLP